MKKENKKRGVKKGTKRGTYKKNDLNLKNSETKKEEIDFKKNDDNKENTSNIKDEIENEIKTENKNENNFTIDEKQESTTSNHDVKKHETDNLDLSAEKNLKDFLRDYEEKKIESKENDTNTVNENKTVSPPPTQPTSSSISVSNEQKMIVNGTMLIAFCDFVFPFVLKKVYSFFDKKANSISLKDIKLDSEQKESLMPIADQVAVYVFQGRDPIFMFFLSMGIMYFSNISTSISILNNK